MKIQRKITQFALAMIAVTLLFSCKKKSDDPAANGGKKAKITITLSGDFKKAEGDYFDVDVAGGRTDASSIDWLVNGVTKKGTVITVGTDDFNGGKTIVLESASNFFAGSVQFGGFEFGATPFTVDYKIEVDGKVIDQGTERIVKDRSPIYTKSYQL
ncbi:hypothetical protein DBR40_11350 [Pedobacter sp. KBW01]|uniref:hypothetical protein n=1 Tax=Pedobacter sp. KBW01 TaxID=2153364 RepID=UPI000F5A2315|nr:hypothetical protein [Pedobacter sp. KBW01]RQO76495.1 hypothetical protein DBR40_11350 [Pedobacter sp. KBW01]